MKIVTNILESMEIGSNCGTTASRIILKHYGYKLSEDMIFGLGSGLGFIYQYYANDNTYFLSGKNESLENNIANLFGGTVETGFFDNEEKAFNDVKKYIDADVPVILDVSIRYLPYFTPYLESVGNIGFGLHNVVLIGYDIQEQSVLLLDHRWNEPQKILMKDLIRARGATDSGMNPRNAFKVYILPDPPDDYSRYIKYAIRIDISRMVHPFAYKMGLKGIKTFAHEIMGILESEKWPESAEALGIYASLMEKLGTGGGNFRRMYGRFLKEAAEMVNCELYYKIGNSYMQLARDWKNLYICLNEAISANNKENRKKLQHILEVIIDKEYKLIQQLQNM